MGPLPTQNIDTDQIIPAEYLTLVPSKACRLWGGSWHSMRAMQKAVSSPSSRAHTIPSHTLTNLPMQPDEYEKLGSYALIGLPENEYPTRYVEADSMKTEYPVIIGGDNFGCGSSREHAPVALGAAGGRVVVAESFARIFFRNSVATGELYPVESEDRLCDELQTGQEVIVDMEQNKLTVVETGKTYSLKELGAVSEQSMGEGGRSVCVGKGCSLVHEWVCACIPDQTLLAPLASGDPLAVIAQCLDPQYLRFFVQAGPVIDAGGLFNYARQGARPRVYHCCAPT